MEMNTIELVKYELITYTRRQRYFKSRHCSFCDAISKNNRKHCYECGTRKELHMLFKEMMAIPSMEFSVGDDHDYSY